jgi:hypothetical protein
VPQIIVTLGFNFSSSKKSTRVWNLVVKHVPAGSTVEAVCPKGCAKKSLKKTGASGQVSLKTLGTRKLNVGAAITVIVSKPGSSAAVKILKIRAKKAPLVTTRCKPEGASEPVAC